MNEPKKAPADASNVQDKSGLHIVRKGGKPVACDGVGRPTRTDDEPKDVDTS